ncbi:hypothetical protein KR054_004191 [Drosophila jambulina]|nr:hypothetical protein KR054_004191 [Drosophila jambulina]
MTTSLGDCITNYIYLTANEDYAKCLAKLCERCAVNDNRVLLITNRKGITSSSSSSKCLKILQLADIESTPCRLLDLQGGGSAENPISAPDLIVFDLHSLVLEAIQRPVMQQCSTDQMVRHIAKCAAAFANYRELVANMELRAERKSLDTVVVMSQDSYPMTPAQFKLLIGLYFYGNECHTIFSQLAGRISVSQGCV